MTQLVRQRSINFKSCDVAEKILCCDVDVARCAENSARKFIAECINELNVLTIEVEDDFETAGASDEHQNWLNLGNCVEKVDGILGHVELISSVIFSFLVADEQARVNDRQMIVWMRNCVFSVNSRNFLFLLVCKFRNNCTIVLKRRQQNSILN